VKNKKLAVISVLLAANVLVLDATAAEKKGILVQSDQKEAGSILCEIFPSLCFPTTNGGGNGGGSEPPT
jgi:hypothetical protein